MSPKPYSRPKPPARKPRPDGQLEVDQRCVQCRCGSHRACASKTCSCAEDGHGAVSSTQRRSDASDPRPGPLTPGTPVEAPQRGSETQERAVLADGHPPPTATDQEDR